MILSFETLMTLAGAVTVTSIAPSFWMERSFPYAGRLTFFALCLSDFPNLNHHYMYDPFLIAHFFLLRYPLSQNVSFSSSVHSGRVLTVRITRLLLTLQALS